MKIAQARRAQKFGQAIEQQKADQERTYQEAMVQDAKDRLAELTQQHKTEASHWDLSYKAAQALQKLQQAKDQQEMVEKSNASGVPIPGAAVQSPVSASFQPGAIGVSSPARAGT